MFFKKQALSALTILFFSVIGFGQDNLSINYSGDFGVAEHLNICGDPDTVSVRVQVSGGSNANRSDISSTIQLFAGINFIEIISGTSSGVVLTNNSNPNRPVLSLPDLSPSGQTFVDIAFSIEANCAFLDSLETNQQALVFDTWDFNYSLGGTTNLFESDNLPEYRDAFLVPFFTMEVEPRSNPVKVGECFNRELKITNTSLGAYVSEMTYEVEQEIGVIVDDILVNGTSVNFTSSPAGPNANRLSITLDASIFSGNQNVLGGAGNGDQRFDANEFLTITEVLCFQSCDLGRASTHSAKWGCGGNDCNEITAVDFIATGLGSPTPSVEVISNVDPGYCGTGSSTLRFSNIGYEDDLGFGAMFDITAGIGLSGDFELDLNGYQITAIDIAGVNIANFNALNSLNDHPDFVNDPDGIGGLSDIDNDGFFDDLPVGESFDVTAFVAFDCQDASTISHPDSCFNNFSTSFNGRIDYTNSCDKRDLRLQNSYYRPTNSNSGFENFADTDAFLGEGTFSVRHIEQRSIRSFETACPDGGQLVAKVVLPSGVTPVLAQTELIKNSTASFVLNNSFQTGDTLNLVFGGPLIEFLSGTYELVLTFEADCNAELGPTEFPLIFEFQCSDCNCSHIWFCDELIGPWLHASNPPCPTDVLIDCPVGIQTGSFDVERTTIGFTDNSYDTKFPKNQANLKVAIPCDSVKMSITNVVGDLPLTDDFGVIIGYDNVDNSDSPEQVFLFTDGNLTVVQNGVEIDIPVSNSELTTNSNDQSKELRFDLGSLVQGLNITLNPGDSVNFEGNFAINPDGPIPFQFRGVPNFRAYGYILQNNEPIYCDKFGENFTLGKTNSVFDFPNNLDFPKGCNTGILEYRLITVNNGFSDFFGDEIRPATKIDSLVIDFETSIFDAFIGGTVEVLVPGHPVFGSDYFPVKPLSDFPGGRYVALFDTLDYVPALNERGNTNFSLRINLEPTCGSYVLSEDGDNRYRFNSKMTFRDRYYANFIGNGSCMVLRDEEVNQEIDYSIPPELELSPVSNANFTLLGDTAVWRLEICNQSALSDAGITWLAIENPDNAIEVVSMTDITDPSNLESLTVEKYGDNYFAFANGVLKGSGGNTIQDICNVIEVKALVQVCGTSILSAKTGWNCQAFPDPDWSPEINAPCSDKSIPLSISTRDPRLEADLVDQPLNDPEICDTTTITVLLKNVDLGAVFDLNTVLTIPPTGATFIPGSVEIAYPASNDFEPAIGDPSFINMDPRGLNYEYNGFGLLNNYLEDEGLSGFNQSNPTDSNQLKIRYKFITDCDFVSGSLAYFSFQGTKGCREASNFEAGETMPIYLNGAAPDPNKLFLIDFEPNTSLASGSSDFEISVTNLTNTPSDSNDKIRFTLPVNTSYQTGSSMGVTPSGWVPGDPLVQMVGGVEELIWNIPPGLVLNEQATLRLVLNTPQYDCESPDESAKLAVVSQTILTCQSSGTPCDIQVINSAGGDDFIVLPVGESLSIDNIVLDSECDLSNEIVHAGFTFSTNGFQFNSEQIVINYFFDQNGNAEFDTGELIFSTTKTAPSSGTIWNIEDDFSTQVDQTCALGIFINPDNLPLCERTEFILPVPVLRNAGEVSPICNNNANITANLGVTNCQSTSYSYAWNAIAPANISMLSALDIANPQFSAPNISGNQEYIFILETTRLGCIATQDTVIISTGEPVSANFTSPVFIPLGSSQILDGTASGGLPPYQYSWSPATGLDQTNIANPTASPDSDTQYTLTVIDSVGCSDEAIVQAIVDNPIMGNVSFSDTSICFGTNIQLFASGGTDYVWTADAANILPGNLTDFDIANPAFENGVAGATYNFDVIITDSNSPGFADTISVVIRMGIPVQINLSPREVIVIGDSINLNPIVGGGILPLQFDWTPTTDLRNPNSQSTFASPSQNIDYTLVVTDAIGCESSASVFVEVRNPIEGDVNFTDTSICSGNTVQIIASGGTDYQWIANVNNPVLGTLSDFNISNPIFENGLAGETYEFSVVVSDNTLPGSTDTLSVSIFVNELPIVEAGRDVNLCNGESIDLTSTASGGNGNYTFVWSSGDALATTTVAPIATTMYFVTATDASGCQNVDSVQVNLVNCPCELPEVTDISIQNSTCGEANGSATVSVAGDINDYIFNWTPSNNNPAPNIAIEMTYGRWNVRVTRTRDLDCFIDVPILISNQDGPDVTIQTSSATCSLSNGSAILTSSNFDYLWQDNSTDAVRNDLAAGFYYPTVTDPAAPDCQNVLMIEIEEENPLSAQVIFNNLPDCGARNGSVRLQVSGTPGPFSYSWAGGTDTQNGLAAGVYFVTITDLSGNGCELPLSFNLPENASDATVLLTAVNQVQCIGTATGSVEFDVNFDTNFTFPADTIITDGFQNFTNGNLPEGDYCLEIYDAAQCLAGSECFTISSSEPIEITANSFEECQNLGRIDLTITGGNAPFSFNWLDLNNAPGQPQNRTDLLAGAYFVTVTDSNDCEVEATVAVDSCEQCFIITAKDTLLFQAATCEDEVAICIPVDFQTANQLEIFDNGIQLNQFLRPCDLDTILIYSFRNLYGEGDLGPYMLQSWTINGNLLQGTFNDLPDLEVLFNQLDPSGNWVLNEQNKSISGGNLNSTYSSIQAADVTFNISTNHLLFVGNPAGGHSFSIGSGFHEIIVSNPPQGCFDTIYSNVVCAVNDTIYLDLILGNSDTICLAGNELLGSIDDFYNNCPDGTFVDYQFLNDSCVIITADSLGQETACLVICDDLGICDTTFVITTIDKIPLPQKIFKDTVGVGQLATVCCDTPQVRLDFPIETIRNICPDSSGVIVQFELDTIDNCLNYTGLEEGIETACIEFCDAFGNCDTVLFEITVEQLDTIIRDTILLDVEKVTYCFPRDSFPPIVQIYDDCPQSNGTDVTFSIDSANLCVTYSGINLGIDTSCIVLVGNNGISYRTTFIIDVVTPSPEVFCDSIFVGQELAFILDPSEIGGEIDTIYELCQINTGHVSFSIPESNNSILYEGEMMGKDSSCFVFCDERGACDTVYFCIEVSDYCGPPVLLDDIVDVDQNTIIIINPGINDTLYGVPTCPRIITQPSAGQVAVNTDCSLAFIQDEEGGCDTEITFEYVICNTSCNDEQCDTATVTVNVRCIDITIFNAVSPNLDGINDSFYIGGIEDKPDNLLRVYNRWGNLVFEQENYQNNWTGTFNGKELPDGSYFYIFEVVDNGERRLFRGYMEIYR